MTDSEVRLNPKAYQSILDELHRVRGLDFSLYREGTVQRRITARLKKTGHKSLQDYFIFLKHTPNECDHLVDSIGVNVSDFFRDPAIWEILKKEILPDLMEQKRDIEVWSAGCATGEEAWSLAILFDEFIEKNRNRSARVFATDMDKSALLHAQTGIYSHEEVNEVPFGRVTRSFDIGAKNVTIKPVLRELVLFGLDDLSSDRWVMPPECPAEAFDLICCRNVLIYFSRELQRQVLCRLYKALRPGGYLVLGKSESISTLAKDQLRVVDMKNRIYQKPKETEN